MPCLCFSLLFVVTVVVLLLILCVSDDSHSLLACFGACDVHKKRSVIEQQRIELQSRTEMLERAKVAIENLRTSSLEAQETMVQIDKLQNEVTTIKLERGYMQQQTRALENLVQSLQSDKEHLFQQIESMKRQMMDSRSSSSSTISPSRSSPSSFSLEHSMNDNYSSMDLKSELYDLGRVKDETRREFLEKMSIVQKQRTMEEEKIWEHERTIERLKLSIKDVEKKLEESEETNKELESQKQRDETQVTKIRAQIERRESKIQKLTHQRKKQLDKRLLQKLEQELDDVGRELNITNRSELVGAIKDLVILCCGAKHWIQDSTGQPMYDNYQQQQPQQPTKQFKKTRFEDSIALDEDIMTDLIRLQMK